MPNKVQHFILELCTELPRISQPKPPLYCHSIAHSISNSLQSFSLAHRLRLDLEPLDLVLEGADLTHQVRGLVGGDRAGDDSASDATGTAKSHLGGNVDVRNVLVLAEEGQVEEDGQGTGVGSEDDDLGDTAVEGLGGLAVRLLVKSSKQLEMWKTYLAPFFS